MLDTLIFLALGLFPGLLVLGFTPWATRLLRSLSASESSQASTPPGAAPLPPGQPEQGPVAPVQIPVRSRSGESPATGSGLAGPARRQRGSPESCRHTS